ncbi:hypothetical protein SDJN03_16038, partial [Cucurbita argyrosperma subsp. sororia]
MCNKRSFLEQKNAKSAVAGVAGGGEVALFLCTPPPVFLLHGVLLRYISIFSVFFADFGELRCRELSWMKLMKKGL